ncbi:MAG: PBP1A family penicillin-binding protein [Rhodospirillales bacterium]|nr:PBP1A family penicillin-binding protein [Rhodospirillales bacterium]
MIGLVWILVAGLAVLAWFAATLPDIDKAANAPRRPGITLVAADGQPIAAFGDLYGRPVRLADLPPFLPQAVIAIEDRRFPSHFGLDPIGLARAFWVNLRAGRVVQGGSTISQQVAKNLFLTAERTAARKIQELLLALWLERKFGKERILELYLDRVYLGAGTYGVDAAARRYFGVPAEKVTLLQAAVLAGLPKAPSRLNPARDPQAALARARQVLAAMRDQGRINAAEERAALAQAPGLARAQTGGFARHFADWVLEQVDDHVGPIERDLVVVTSLERSLQRRAEQALVELLDGPGRQAQAGEGAVVVLGLDGAVRALVGGRDWSESAFNRATDARRQPGSAFKPIVFLAALEAGLLPTSLIDDAPIDLKGWRPENFDGRYRGPVALDQALAQSLNTVAVRLVERTGAAKVVTLAERLGLTTPLRADASIALGTSEVTLLELAGVYAAFATGGRGVWPHAIREIRDVQGRVLYRRSGGGPGPVIAPPQARALDAMLKKAVAEGTGQTARIEGLAVAGKTGTTQDHRDAWFLGYTDQLVAGVWLGNDDGKPMKGVTGGGLPAQLWRALIAGGAPTAPR